MRTVLVFHRVGVDGAGRHDIAWRTFERLLDDLQALPIRFVTDMAAPPSQAPEVALAFDDATADQLAVAAALGDRRIEAVFFIPAGLLESAGRFTHTDVCDLSRAGQQIGSHGFLHVPLDRLSGAEIRREVVDSRLILEDLTGESVTTFAPAHGILSPIARMLAAATYQAIRTGRWGIDHPAGDRLRIPILPVTEETAAGRRLVETALAGRLLPGLQMMRVARGIVPRRCRPAAGRFLHRVW